ncbi:chemotaxis protein CheB [Pontibacter sp. JH31]|uniref:protein-glutamate methylesterase n=1 Tax=Pontibacter aquaedesilientis TaxID=2766980 RepID=A0ABR7XFE5_9BACT|nr:chemotaxis protein CheB [Pontibacter aquaedesilientis]MBD1396298.1 chemotaxis protein CheB [Pontibacter aquaedesilientis]
MIKQDKALRVLVAENSSFSRLVLEDILSKESDLKVNCLAGNGEHMLQQICQNEVDVVIAAADLRQNKRLYAFKRIFSECPTPILMLIEKEQLTLEILKEAIELGVYSIVLKPGPTARPNFRSISEEILKKVRAVRESEYWDSAKRLQMLSEDVNLFTPNRVALKNSTADTIIVIGASTGGAQAVEMIVRRLDPALQASVLIAIHMPPKFTHSYSRRLKEVTSLLVIEGRTGLIPKPGKIIVAPGGRNMIVHSVMGNAASLKIGFSEETLPAYDTPSVDLLMQTVAKSGVNRVIGVILTGMGKDGSKGAEAIMNRPGGHVIAQNEESSVIFGMAKSAIESGNTHKVLHLNHIVDYLNSYVAAQQQVSETDDNT